MRRLVRALVSFLALSGVVLAPGQALAAAGKPGFAFLKVGIGARAMGMGSAYVALADDPTAVYWNTAGLAGSEDAQVTVMHNEWIQDFRQEFAAVSRPLGKGAAGFGISGLIRS